MPGWYVFSCWHSHIRIHHQVYRDFILVSWGLESLQTEVEYGLSNETKVMDRHSYLALHISGNLEALEILVREECRGIPACSHAFPPVPPHSQMGWLVKVGEQLVLLHSAGTSAPCTFPRPVWHFPTVFTTAFSLTGVTLAWGSWVGGISLRVGEEHKCTGIHSWARNVDTGNIFLVEEGRSFSWIYPVSFKRNYTNVSTLPVSTVVSYWKMQ